MKSIFFFLIIIFSSPALKSQVTIDTLKGELTFFSSDNYYIGFSAIDGKISQGDTLFLYSNGKSEPAVIVKYVSSKSVAGNSITKNKLKVGDRFYKLFYNSNINSGNIVIVPANSEKDPLISDNKLNKKSKEIRVDGYLNLQSYSVLAKSPNTNTQQWRVSNYFNVNDMLIEGLRFNSNLSFQYNPNSANNNKKDILKNLRFYNFYFSYSADKFSFVLGRNFNNRLGSMGSIDGLQMEYDFGNFYSGIVVGSHPNYEDYGYNSKYFEYGAFLGRTDTTIEKRLVLRNTIGFIQQTYESKIDRRYLTFQSEAYLKNNFYFVGSAEIDLYEKSNNTPKNSLNLTNAFITTRWNFLENASVSLTYDIRKNIIYYESFKNFVDSLLDKEFRQGFRANTNFQLFRDFSINVFTDYSSKKNDARPSYNIGMSVSHHNLFELNLMPSISGSYLSSSYTNAILFNFRISKSFFDGTLFATVEYQHNIFKFPGYSEGKYNQDNISTYISVNLSRNLFMSANYEFSKDNYTSFSRFLIDLGFRF